MVARGDERGQSIQIGAILLFAVLVLSFATYQAVIVPQQNAAVEAEHTEVVDRQTQDLRNAIVSVPGSSSDRAVTLSLGTTYSPRAVAVNPPPPGGTVRTVGTGTESVNLTLANAVATDGETSDFWNGTDQSRNTGAVLYDPNYNEFRNPGTTVYENTLLYTEFSDGEVSRTGQRLVDGDRLTLVFLNGSLARAGSDSVSLDVQAVSASDRSVAVTNETGANVTVRVASRLSADAWRDLLTNDDQFLDQGGHVVSVTERPLPDPDFDLVAIELEQGVTYTVGMAKVGLGTGVTEEPEVYLTDVQGEGVSVQERSTTSLVVEVRDAYNNPVTGVTVDSSTGSGSLSPQSVTSDTDGQAVFEYEADEVDGVTSRTVSVNASVAVDPGGSFDPSTPENVTVNVTVQNTDGSGVGGSGSTASAEQTEVDSSSKNDADNDGTSETVEFSLENKGSSDVTIETITVNGAENEDVGQVGNGTEKGNKGNANNSNKGNANNSNKGNANNSNYDSDGPELRSAVTLLDTSDPFNLGETQFLDTTSTIAGGSTTDYTLAEFRDTDNNEIDPGSMVKITLGFSDGSEKAVTLTL